MIGQASVDPHDIILDPYIFADSHTERLKYTMPFLIDGATTSKTHTAVKIAPNYSGTVLNVRDASLAVQVSRKLLSADSTQQFSRTIRDEYKVLRDNYMLSSGKSTILPIERARGKKLTIDLKANPPVRPKVMGVVEFIDYSIDMPVFFQAWELQG